MADENEEKKEAAEAATAEAPAQPAKKKFPLKMIIIIVVAVIVVAGGAIGAITFLKGDKEGVEAKEAAATEEVEETASIGIPLETFILNLADKDRNKYLKISMELRVGSEEVKKEIDENMSKIKDIIVVYLSAKTFEEVKTVEGKLQLKAELMKRINSILKKGSVKELYFTEFVVQ
ncbi:MAG: flagellar basal body protein FliL [Candidatus Schekmanbacteria bacterium]|nr:MAG: flagellar basal body protein FliL [Candidatus Schekmanbacteria bacterium]